MMKTAARPIILLLLLVALATVAIDSKKFHHRRTHRTLRGFRQAQDANANTEKQQQVNNRGVPKRTTTDAKGGDDSDNHDDENELGNGTGAGFVRGIGTVTQSVCPICVCYQPCTIQYNTIIIGNDVDPATVEAVLKAQHEQVSDAGQHDKGNLEALLGGGAQERPPPDAGEVTVPGDALREHEDGSSGTSASNSCELKCKIQCSHNCGSSQGTAVSTP